MNNNVNVYALTELRVLLNDHVFNDANKFNELLDIIKSNTNMEVQSIDYTNNKVYLVKNGVANMLVRQICSSLCIFLNNHKLDIQISIDTLEREDDKREVYKVLNDILIGNNVIMLFDLMDLSNEGKTIILLSL